MMIEPQKHRAKLPTHKEREEILRNWQEAGEASERHDLCHAHADRQESDCAGKFRE